MANFPNLVEVYRSRSRQAVNLPKPPASLYQTDLRMVGNKKRDQILRSLRTFTVLDYSQKIGVHLRTARDHIVRLVSEGVIEPVGFEVRQGTGVSSRPMQVFRLKKKSEVLKR